MAIEVTDKLFDIADALEEKKLFRFAEQLRGAGMSMSNNIAEGSGSNSDKEFMQKNHQLPENIEVMLFCIFSLCPLRYALCAMRHAI